MHNIQDKDLDQLFKDKLSDGEVDPPAFLWAKIEQQIQPKRKRFLALYWMAAAMAVLAISAGLLFNRKDKIQLHGNAEVVAIGSKSAGEVKELPVQEAVTTPSEKAGKVLKVKHPTAKRHSEKVLIAMQPAAHPAHLKYINSTKKQELKVAELKMEVAPVPPREVLLAQVAPSPTVTEEALFKRDGVAQPGIANEKNGIKNIGDLVNLVVEKVDKRERKFIQFNSDDEDNSSLVAINIGIIKFNGKNKSKR